MILSDRSIREALGAGRVVSDLSDRSIRVALDAGRIVIDPLGEGAVQPSSVDLRSGPQLPGVVATTRWATSTSSRTCRTHQLLVEVDADDPFILHPGEFVLGATLERVALPDDLVARLEGKSSLGRLGLLIHSTAGFVDPGFDGQLTLELSNVANLPITLYPGMRIGQISFQSMTTAADAPYGSSGLGSKYHGQRGPVPSRYWENFK